MSYAKPYSYHHPGFENLERYVNPEAAPGDFITKHYASLFNKGPHTIVSDRSTLANTSKSEEEPIMKVTYNGYTGELWKFERKPGRVDGKVV